MFKLWVRSQICSVSNIIFLHAASIVYNSRAYIFAASTGSGKTTLTAYLSESGCGYISDDETRIDMTSLRVHSDPKPLHLREESIPILRSCGIDITVPVTETESFRRIVYLPDSLAYGDFSIGGLFFIRRNKSENSCEPVKPTEAVQLIIQNLLSPDVDMSACLRCAVKLAPKCKKLVYSDMSYVLEILKNE